MGGVAPSRRFRASRRNYQSKNLKAELHDAVTECISIVSDGQKPVWSEVAARHDVDRDDMRRTVTGKRHVARKQGRPTVFPKELEELSVRWVKETYVMGSSQKL